MVQVAAEPYPFNGTPEEIEHWHQNRIAPNARWRIRTVTGKVFWIERRFLGMFWIAHKVIDNPMPYTSMATLVRFQSVDEAKAYIAERERKAREDKPRTVYYVP
jgi:hypothetical protein